MVPEVGAAPRAITPPEMPGKAGSPTSIHTTPSFHFDVFVIGHASAAAWRETFVTCKELGIISDSPLPPGEVFTVGMRRAAFGSDFNMVAATFFDRDAGAERLQKLLKRLL
jgi:hypothetical protein